MVILIGLVLGLTVGAFIGAVLVIAMQLIVHVTMGE